MENITPYRILGIDPGTATVGWGIIEVTEKEVDPSVIAFGHIATDKNLSDEVRLGEIALDTEELIKLYKPHVAAVEALFFFKNQKTIITVAQARGVLIHTCHKRNLDIASYTPLQIKQSITGYGRADKKQMQEMVMKTLSLKSMPQPDDTADALAVAICHNNSRFYTQSLERAL